MNNNPRSATWLRIAVVYFSVGVLLGVGMGASGDHTLAPAHAHVNLLGWVSMGLFALVAHAWPATTKGKLATIHLWLYNLALPVMLASLAAKLYGHHQFDPPLGIASILVALAALLFAIQVWRTVER